MLTLQNISYIHPNKELLFDGINLAINPHQKIALIGNNGAGKSTLLKIITNELQPSAGKVEIESTPYYVPQVFGQFNHLNVAKALGIEEKLNALKQILAGNATEENFSVLNDDWTIEDRCREALAYWLLGDLELSHSMASLSGGQKTKVFLAGIQIHQAELILLDEPSNHLDVASRELLYQYIQHTKSTLLVISHDRKLLNLLDTVCELTKTGINVYGGNYDFYTEQKQIATNALHQDIQNKEKALRKAKEKEREALERQQKQDARGKKKQEKAGVARIMMNTLRNNAENSTAKTKDIHTEKIGGITSELRKLRANVADIDQMKFDFDNTKLHKGKVLFKATNLNYSYRSKALWPADLNFQINSGERIALKGDNGSGKTTLIKIILGDLERSVENVYLAISNAVYIDQEYSLIDNDLSVYEQAQLYNTNALQEHEVKIRLNRFLFGKEVWNKPCGNLSGGERMRLMLCCLTVSNIAPDLIILDEPTNNLDIQNIEILTAAINEYEGTLLVVSHDEYFLKQINIEREITLKQW
ncbi:ribosomal protection-like ABC-F family protein [Pedobacter ureilyticus]|uniref:Ribosomal protection-like ABC-F family protein n=1 Tax=Pedobacter ureilyticus TaxID=1393051 RepID=A0ABW9J9W5_9SPHI|nr:ABC-F family ATP-binding cassette domain-containing protein [Pedobacter helvus]